MPKQTLEEALQKLEQITEDLSQKDVDVEAGLQKFREGVELIKFSRAQLEHAENEFQKLKQELETELSHDDRESANEQSEYA